jgi:hypothetical protein
MPDTAPVTIALYRNADTPCTAGQAMFVTIGNSAGLTQNFWGKTPTMQVEVPYHDGLGDDYRVVVNVDGFHNGGGFFQADPAVHPTLSILMMPDKAKPTFPTWADLKVSQPATANLIAGNVTDAVAQANYTALSSARPLALACLMNLSAAMLQIGLGQQKTPLDFIRQVIWDKTLAQDRFFAYVDPAITTLLDGAVAEGEFEQESAADLHLHPGSTSSYKQLQYAYSNVQLTFHANDKSPQPIGGVDCIMIEPDIDLYKELFAHGLGELLPNLISGSKTNPLAVLALRWIDAAQKQEPRFNPGYSLS